MCEIRDSVDKVHSDLQETRLKLSELESHQDEFEGAIVNMCEDIAEGEKHAEYEILTLKDKVNDLENQSRRNNLGLIGFPEGVEGRDAVSFVEEWLPEIIGMDQERPFEIQRAHRTLQRRPSEHDRPRAIVIRLLRFRGTVTILNAARQEKRPDIWKFKNYDLPRYVNNSLQEESASCSYPNPTNSRFLSVKKLTDGSQKRAEAGDGVMM
ncbi:hypothetical protein M9458_006181, partial [Cirrhinus mrigala]